MSLQALLREVDPGWYVASAGDDVAPLDPALLARAATSALGRRMLARWLATDAAPALLAPRPHEGIGAIAQRWSRSRLAALIRDLGALAFAPAVRSEVRRDQVALLKRTFGNGYLLALDNSIWDAKVDATMLAALRNILATATATAKSDGDPAAIHAALDLRGRSELRAWAAKRDPALADWVVLQYPHEVLGSACLPEKQLLFLHGHHEARAVAA